VEDQGPASTDLILGGVSGQRNEPRGWPHPSADHTLKFTSDEIDRKSGPQIAVYRLISV